MSRLTTRRSVAAFCSTAVVLAGCSMASFGDDEELVAATGPDDGEVVNAEALSELAFGLEVVEPEEAPFAEATWTLTSRPAADDAGDDADEVDADEADEVERDVTGEVEVEGDAARYATDDLDDGDHRLTADLPELGSRGVTHTWEFTVAATPPELTITDPDDGVLIASDGLTIAGQTTGVEVTLDGQAAEVADDGTFSLELDDAPGGEVELLATDEHGNTATAATALVVVPSRVEQDTVRAVHVTPHAWATDSFRERIFQMVDDGLVNSVQLDLKDEGGRIGYRTEVELARESGAAEDVYDLDEAVAELHERGVHIVGRIVAFRDPTIGAYAQGAGDMDWLVQTPDGQPYTSRYGCCFTSFANDEVIEYNLAIAEEAAAAGVDGILWDYIRRPDGSPDAMVYDGLSDDADGATLEQAVADFAAAADERLRPYGVDHGASLYGIAADRPTQIAQDVPALSEHLDYVAPMIYPSHWGPGEYGVEDPNAQPYDIITATLEVWEDAVVGDRTRIVPWLEDTSYRAWDRPFQVREQIRATNDHGIDEWLMWDPVVQYTLEAYDPQEIDADDGSGGSGDGSDDGGGDDSDDGGE